MEVGAWAAGHPTLANQEADSKNAVTQLAFSLLCSPGNPRTWNVAAYSGFHLHPPCINRGHAQRLVS